MFHYYFDTSRIYVVNDAMGGTSSASYQSGLWLQVLPKIHAGDFVLMAFGHNDSRATIKGNGDEVQGTMHTFGWYMRQFVEQTKAKGATPIVLSLIPRNRWANGKVNRNAADYALWAKQAAEQEKVDFIPLNDLIADKYDALGMAKVQAELFPPNEAVHPNWAGAKLNAEIVVEGIKALKDCPLKGYLLKDPKCPETPDVRPPARGEMGPSAKAPVGRPDAPATASAPAPAPK
jgi:lysophospholipase L1-like esterase